MMTRSPKLSQIAIMAGFSLSVFGLLLFLWLAFGGPIPLQPKGYRFKVAFTDAASLAPQADVRIAGVNVGKVVAKQLAPEGNRTLATIQLQSKYAPIHRDARAILRQKTLLGETFVQLTPGSRRAPLLRDGQRLANSRVAPTVQFDELLELFDKPTRRAFQQWQTSTAKSSGGHAQDINDALGNLPGFVTSANDVVNVLDKRRVALSALVRNTGVTFNAISRDEDALQSFITNDTHVLDTLAARREALADSIQAFPTFLTESRATLRRLQTFAPDTTPLLRDLKPVLQDAQPTLASLRTLSPDAKALFNQLPALVRAGNTGLPALSNVLHGLDPTLGAIGPFLQQLNPMLSYLEMNQSVISDFLNIGPSALNLKTDTTPGSGSNGHVLPQLIMMGSQSLPALTRTSDNRGNTYFAPGALTSPALKRFFTLPNWDCVPAGGEHPSTSGSEGCVVQGPIPFQGRNQRFPQVREAASGGRTSGSGS
jgi:phospholipid/cholesterol/gamma-HCH transport system substrate-binding protein